jgi:hypothetical protein
MDTPHQGAGAMSSLQISPVEKTEEGVIIIESSDRVLEKMV